jgi:hypothetical protein
MRIVRRIWTWCAILLTLVLLFPISTRTTRVLTVIGIALVWGGALLMCKRRRVALTLLLLISVVLFSLFLMPGRNTDASALRADYCRGLQLYTGDRYIWGGEGCFGIDCSGLIRKGLVWGQFINGARTMNGRPLRNAITLWWHDCSAKELLAGFRGWTRVLSTSSSINGADQSALLPGDLAVTTGGAHILAYLGKATWIEADPMIGKVVKVSVPTDNPWFNRPVVFIRWSWLEDQPS